MVCFSIPEGFIDPMIEMEAKDEHALSVVFLFYSHE